MHALRVGTVIDETASLKATEPVGREQGSFPPAPPASAAARYVTARLRGTVWERIELAHGVYRLLMGLGSALGRAGISPNFLTYSSIVFAASSAWAVADHRFALAAALMITAGACDLLDGVVARATHAQSGFGALLDSTADRLADGLPLLGLVVAYADNKLLAAIPSLALLGSFAVPYVRARAETLGVVLPPLFMRRPERVVLLIGSLLLGEISLIENVRAPLLLAGIAVMAVSSFVGAAWALKLARVELDRLDGPAKKSLDVTPHDSGPPSI